jgi:periplasmic glucans biosynthesis protein
MTSHQRPYSRRRVLATASAGIALAAFGAPPVAAATLSDQAVPFDQGWLHQRVQEMAGKPFEAPKGNLPAPLPDLNFEQYQEIRFRPDQALWRDQGLTFEAQFFHPGYQYRDPVRVFEVADGMAREVMFAPSLFDYGKSGVDPATLTGLGFAGFRLHYPLNRPDYYDELAVFLGASYFRGLGRHETFGLSARGLAVNTALPEGEEFPAFRAFWIERPRPGAAEITLHALLDSPSIVGAYSFSIRPADTSVFEVSVFLMPRAAIKLVGISPLTSMYFFGENDRLGVDDFRPEVHDSDGLAIWHASGEWLWRPLVNPAELAITSFGDDSPRGFGLLQRDREFTSYQDLFSHPELRPTLWVEPLDGWGKGEVRLIEIPSDQEIHDNIVAFWVPEKPFAAGQAVNLGYRLHWGAAAPFQPNGATVRSTRIGRGKGDNARRYVIDFAGGELSRLAPDAAVEAVITTSKGKLNEVLVQPNPAIGGWRTTFDLVPEDDTPADLRLFLKMQDKVLSETWSYRWTR